MNVNPISHLIDFFGEKWILNNLQKMHSLPGKKGHLPPAQSTLTMIRSHPVIQHIWAIEKFIIDITKRKIDKIPHTNDFTQLLYLTNSLFYLKIRYQVIMSEN